jgi:hypothetical protein
MHGIKTIEITQIVSNFHELQIKIQRIYHKKEKDGNLEYNNL